MQVTKDSVHLYSRDGKNQILTENVWKIRKTSQSGPERKSKNKKNATWSWMKWTEARLTERVLDSGKNQKLITDMSHKEHRTVSLLNDVYRRRKYAGVPLWMCKTRSVAKMRICHAGRHIMEETMCGHWIDQLLSFRLMPSKTNSNCYYHHPANLTLWGKSNLGLCQLCSHQSCILLYIGLLQLFITEWKIQLVTTGVMTKFWE